MISTKNFNDKKCNWIDVNSDEPSEVFSLHEKYGVSDEVLAYALDRDEQAHLEYEETTKTFFLIYNVPFKEKVDNHYETIPMTFIIKEDNLITVSSRETKYLTDKMAVFLENNSDISVFELLFNTLCLVSDSYFPIIEEITVASKQVNRKLREKTTSKNILELSDLEIGLVYFVMASEQNVVLLQQLKAQYIYRNMSELEREQLDDALIEAKQIVEMTQLISQILKQLSETFNNLLNNNLNDVIKILTVLSVLLPIPTIVSGFFGMNMPLPLEENHFGWIISLGMTMVLWLGLAFVLRKKMR